MFLYINKKNLKKTDSVAVFIVNTVGSPSSSLCSHSPIYKMILIIHYLLLFNKIN